MVCCGYFRDGQIFDKACAASGSEPEMKKNHDISAGKPA